MQPSVSPEVIARLSALVAELSRADSADEVLRVAFLIHCELKAIVTAE